MSQDSPDKPKDWSQTSWVLLQLHKEALTNLRYSLEKSSWRASWRKKSTTLWLKKAALAQWNSDISGKKQFATLMWLEKKISEIMSRPLFLREGSWVTRLSPLHWRNINRRSWKGWEPRELPWRRQYRFKSWETNPFKKLSNNISQKNTEKSNAKLSTIDLLIWSTRICRLKHSLTSKEQLKREHWNRCENH